MNPQPGASTVYLDHAATTPMRQCALDTWREVTEQLRDTPGNPAALHAGGRRARQLLERARSRVAAALGVERAEVFFTSGATESNALGIAGAWRQRRAQFGGSQIVQVGAADHPSSLKQLPLITAAGGRVELLPIDHDGRVRVNQLHPHVSVVAVSAVSSEIGVIQPMEQIGQRLTEMTPQSASNRDDLSDDATPDSLQSPTRRAHLHVDITQALTTSLVELRKWQVDSAAFAGHKIGGPVANGVFILRRGAQIITDRPGGDQESTWRSGTVDVAGACALASAVEETVQQREEARAHAAKLRALLLDHLAELPAVTLTTSAPSVPNIIHLSLPTAHPEAVLLSLDRDGICASAGSACHAGVTRPAQVLLAMGRTERQALGTLRISTAHCTTPADILALVRALPRAVSAGQALDALDGSR